MKKSTYLKIDQTAIQTAKRVNLRNFLRTMYPDEIIFDRKTRQYRNPKHDSLVINEHAWYRFSTGKGGDTIQYLVNLLNKDFCTAVIELVNYTEKYGENEPTRKGTARPCLPPPLYSGEPTLLRAYLAKRALSDSTVNMLFDKRLVYEDIYHNAVFNVPGRTMYIIKGIGESRYNRIETATMYDYWYFKAGNNPDCIYICESPIDALSLYECNRKKSGIYAAMAGLKMGALNRILQEQNPTDNKSVFIAVDWDEKGMQFYKNNALHKRFPFMSAGKYKTLGKDWNEVLVALSAANA